MATNRRAGLLTGWKAIADHFGRNQSTVRRWAETRALPIHRAAGSKGGSIYAYESELDEWLTKSTPAAEVTPDADGQALTSDQAAIGTLSTENAVPRTGRPADDDAKGGAQASDSLKDSRTPSRIRLAASALASLVVVALLGYFAIAGSGLTDSAGGAGTSIDALPEDVAALYRDAGYLWPKRTKQTLLEAEELLTRVSERAPQFAAAQADLATVYNLMVEYHVKPAEEGYGLSMSAAERAIALDPRQAAALTVLGDLSYYWKKDYDAAFRYFDRAVAVEPDNAQARQWYASALMTSGRLDEAEQQIRKARDLKPDSRSIIVSQAMIELGQGEVRRARAALLQLLNNEASYRNPYRFLLFAEVAANDLSAYRVTMRDWFELIDSPAGRSVAEAAEAGWDAGGANAMITAMADAVRRDDIRDSVEQYFRAHVLALAGDWRGALEQLARTPTRQAFYYSIDPAFAEERANPEFLEEVATLGFPVVGAKPI